MSTGETHCQTYSIIQSTLQLSCFVNELAVLYVSNQSIVNYDLKNEGLEIFYKNGTILYLVLVH